MYTLYKYINILIKWKEDEDTYKILKLLFNTFNREQAG